MKKMGFRACGGFRCKQHNRPRREWEFRIAIKGTFLSRRKGDIIKVARQRRLACVVFSEREELFQIVPRGLSAILADLEGLRIAGFPSPLLTVEFHQGIAVT